MAEIDCQGRSTREINTEIKRLIQAGAQVVVRNPAARHNLAVAILQPGHVVFQGSVGYYCGGLTDGATIEIHGSAGWGVGESMLSGRIIVRGHAGNSAGAAMRGGEVIIHGDAGARAGVSMKGGLLLIAGNCGYMTGFMGQKGTIVVCGDAAEGFADSMYETVCYVGGKIRELGNDAVLSAPAADDIALLDALLNAHFLPGQAPAASQFRKVVAGRRLWNFDRRDWQVWQEAL